MIRDLRLLAPLLLLIALSSPVAAQYQEDGERSTQARLPQGRSPLWVTLRLTKIGINEARGLFTATFPAPVKGLAGQTVTLAGFINPLDAQTRGTHFLLSKYTPVCSFCPPGEPNEVVEVRTASPIVFVQKLVTVTGRFALQNNGEQGLFFQMTGATVR
ncbi:hypothetical protein Sj15T_11840 [Sphingobium sp. TA15]|uniref:DUF3299 domain-containing protein n=1 Tax=Sphingobium indicum (strain DSM 16413 / CCM 7287 / MTCC 6362 / UT26 / NBRC 101211 / UT26S) TaxID=452662 RepID=D4Z297_SPHIU|nr:DUF3299 domain-containing protein [Sphingobium indicum]BAI96729.1 conserved hypothetical protein [Sphingobium indicum UT26S]BDD66163.1 hypothetical protein Sj15T_11840 [Sphingobium sp. TA15]